MDYRVGVGVTFRLRLRAGWDGTESRTIGSDALKAVNPEEAEEEVCKHGQIRTGI